MSFYPPRHHPVFFLQDELERLGAAVEFTNRDERTEGCWGLMVNGRVVVYLIDNRWMHERVKEDPAAAKLMAKGALVMCAQKPDAERVGAKWLPLASSPGYRPSNKEMPKLHEVSFIGYIHDETRLMMLKRLSRCFQVINANGLFGEDAVRVYWNSQIGLNVPTRYGDPLCYDVNMRVMEVLAAGTPLVTNHLPELEDLGLLTNVNCVTYSSAEDMIYRIDQLLQHPENAERIGANGAKLAAERHTYRHRAEQVLEWLK